MKKSLDIDNPFFAFMGWLADVAIVNILFLVCSLPVITMGAATVAMYQTFREIREGKTVPAFRNFFSAFGRSFRKSLPSWFLQLLTGLLLAFDLGFVVEMENVPIWHMVGMILGCMILLWVMISCYLLPGAVYEGKTIKSAVSESLYLAVKNLPRTVVMGLLNIIPIACIVLGNYFIGVMMPIYITVGFGITAWLNILLLEKCKGRQ